MIFTITLTIVVITCLVSFAAYNNEKIMNDLLFWPAEIQSRNQYYRFFTCGLVHADIMHLVFNMWALYTFGKFVEQYLFSHPALFGASGKLVFLVLYVSAVIISAVPDYFKNRDNFGYRALGASGAVSAVIFAGIMLQPNIPISILFIPFGIPGYIFGILFLGLSAYLAKRGGSNIGHGAHFTGAIYGLVFTIVTTKVFADFDAVKAFLNAIMNQ